MKIDAEDLVRGTLVHFDFPSPTAVPDANGIAPDLSVLLAATSFQVRNHFRELVARGGYRVVEASSGKEALKLLRLSAFAIAILHDTEDFTPTQLSREIKVYAEQKMQHDLPVILLASNFDPDYAVRCLQAGLDDYITGPHLEPRVLLARIEAVLRSYRRHSVYRQREPKAVVTLSRLLIDPERYRVEVDGSLLDLTRIQFILLYSLASQTGQILTRSQLRDVIAELGGNPDDNSIKSHIHHLRRRLGDAGDCIKTVRGVGYRFDE